MRRIERERVNVITLHLGNGCSACAIRKGDSFDTSMGLTPLEGLLMGTRSGDVDASILEYLARKENLTLGQLGELLNERSGLLGLSGMSPDMRTLLEREGDDPRARLAIDVFCHRARKYVGAYYAAMHGADAIIFTGGIGENSPIIRRRICGGLQSLGLRLDAFRNDLPGARHGWEISAAGAVLKAYVIPTDEELLIARDTYRVIAASP
jgi:acetate kinase